MAARRRPSKSSTPLDDRQQKLLAQQEELQKRMEKLNQVIAEAPRIKAERERTQREQLLSDRSSRSLHRLNSTTLADPRFDQYPGPGPSRTRRRPLKAERRQTLLYTISLLVILAIFVVWLLSVFHWQWAS
jgi:hypothetical protein